MFKRLVKKIAQKHMELRYPQQPLRLQPDYGERNAADFLGEKTVQLNTGYGDLKSGPGNLMDEVVADNLFSDETEGFEIVDDIGLDRMADHEESGSYMSRQNLREMGDMADFIVDDIGLEGLEDWVEDKISQSYAALNDVARYRGYRDNYSQSDDNQTFRLAEDDIIDDLDDLDDDIIDDVGLMAEFDKYSRYSKGEKGKEEYAKAKEEGKVPDEFLEYEGSVTSPGEAPDPSIIENNREEMGKSAHYYDIIDDLEW